MNSTEKGILLGEIAGTVAGVVPLAAYKLLEVGGRIKYAVVGERRTTSRRSRRNTTPNR